MADGKTQKMYTLEVKGGRITLQMKTKGADGLFHSASCDYPRYEYEEVEHHYINADGQPAVRVEMEMVRKTRKQTETMLFNQLKHYYMADGN